MPIMMIAPLRCCFGNGRSEPKQGRFWHVTLEQSDDVLTARLPELVYGIGIDLVVEHHVVHHLL
jgi:hypothetical protein